MCACVLDCNLTLGEFNHFVFSANILGPHRHSSLVFDLGVEDFELKSGRFLELLKGIDQAGSFENLMKRERAVLASEIPL